MFAACINANVPPVEISLLIVCIMQLTIDGALPDIRQQLVDAHLVTQILACTSAASQLHLAGWT